MTGALLDVASLEAGYGRTSIVRDLSLQVHAGTVVALLGPNGAGKTTTLLTLAGVLPMLGGHVRVVGREPCSPHRLARQGLAFVPDQRGLFSSLTVAENWRVRSGARDIEARALSLFPNLSPHLNRPAGLLSGGQQQMVALAGALATRPRLLIIDEMTIGLAPQVVSEVLPVLRRAADQEGCGVLLVEQQVHAALEIADHVVVLRQGRTTLNVDAAEVRQHPEMLESEYLGVVSL